MKSKAYYYPARYGQTVIIKRSPYNVSRWAVYIDEMLICDDFGSASDAAIYAHDRDFATVEACQSFANIWVPAELSQWYTEPPEFLKTAPPSNGFEGCRSRSQRADKSGRFW